MSVFPLRSRYYTDVNLRSPQIGKDCDATDAICRKCGIAKSYFIHIGHFVISTTSFQLFLHHNGYTDLISALALVRFLRADLTVSLTANSGSNILSSSSPILLQTRRRRAAAVDVLLVSLWHMGTE